MVTSSFHKVISRNSALPTISSPALFEFVTINYLACIFKKKKKINIPENRKAKLIRAFREGAKCISSSTLISVSMGF